MALQNTLVEVINRVLIAVGQAHDQVTASDGALTDNYHIKVAQFVNDTLEEVEDAANWRVLRTRDTGQVAANGISVALTNATPRSREFLVVDPNSQQLVPLVYDVTDGSQQYRLWPMDLSELLTRDQMNSNQVEGTRPAWYALEPTATGMNIYTYPRCSSARDIEIDMIIPQARMPTASEANLNVAIKVPDAAVEAGAYARALLDRDGLTPEYQSQKKRYDDLLGNYAGVEMALQGADEMVPT